MKLVDYAKKTGVSYRTAWRWFRSGKLPGKQMETGTIIVDDPATESTCRLDKTVVYARVSSGENKSNLDSQAVRLSDYCSARGYVVHAVVKEVASGVNDSRPKLLKILTDETITRIVVEHKDRLTRFGFNYIEQLLKMQGRSIEVVNLAENGRDDLLQDFVSIITSFCARLYGQRRSKRKTEKLIEELSNNKD